MTVLPINPASQTGGGVHPAIPPLAARGGEESRCTNSETRKPSVCHCGSHAWFSLTKGFVALVSPDDISRVGKYRWFSKTTIYPSGTFRVDGRKKGGELLHRFIIQPEKNLFVDHINCNSLDNRRDNLRVCSNSENSRNARKSRNRSSPYKGVCWDRSKGKWRAGIRCSSINKFLGYFRTEEEAAGAYNKAAIIEFGPYARLNVIGKPGSTYSPAPLQVCRDLLPTADSASVSSRSDARIAGEGESPPFSPAVSLWSPWSAQLELWWRV